MHTALHLWSIESLKFEIMKTILVSLIMFASVPLVSQNVVEWKGGTPGFESDWNTASNWNSNRVPDENTRVLIKGQNTGHNAMPIVAKDVVVASIELEQGAVLTVNAEGSVLVDGSEIFSFGIVCRNSQVVNNGRIVLKNIEYLKADQFLQYTHGDGLVYMEDHLLDKGSDMNYTFQSVD